jgi:hypothetical protein
MFAGLGISRLEITVHGLPLESERGNSGLSLSVRYLAER